MPRPPKYDKEKLLEQASELFWERGYRGITIGDLTKATGVLPGSLYALFGSKEGVFLSCIDHYGKKAKMFRDATSDTSPLQRIESYFTAILQMSIDGAGRKGCFMVNAILELAQESDKLSKAVTHHMQVSEAWFKDCLDEAILRGELSGDANTTQLAEMLQSVLQALQLKTRAFESIERLSAYLDSMLETILSSHRLDQACSKN